MTGDNNYFINYVLKRYLGSTIIVLLEVSSISFYNTLIVGKMLGSEALAVMSLTSSFSFLYYMFGCLINIGAAIAASVALGQNDYQKVGKLERFAFYSSIVVPLVISLLLLMVMHPLLIAMGADESMYELSKSYVRITLLLGFVYTLMYFLFNFLRVDGRSKLATRVFALMEVLDFVSVFLVLKTGLGLTGVGYAAMLSALLADIVGILVLFYGKNRQIKMVNFSIAEMIPLATEIFAFGSSSGLNNLWNMLRNIALNKMVAAFFGTGGLAAFGVVCSVINLSNATTLGIGQTTAPLVGVFYGERDNKGIIRLMRSGARNSVMIHLILGAGLFVFAPWVAYAFGIPDTFLRDTVWLIRWSAIGLTSCGIVNLYIQAFAALRRVLFSNVLTLLRSYVFVVSAAYLWLISPLKSWYITAFMLADLLTIGVMYLYAGWMRRRDENLTGVLMLDKRMEEGDFLSVSVSAAKGSEAEASEKIAAFCEENELPPKLAMGIPLAVEEILNIMSEKCFHNDDSKYSDVRIVKNGEDILICVRCGGECFNPMEWYKDKCETLSFEERLEDPSLGMKLLNDISKKITFNRTLGVNNLLVLL